MAPVHINSIYVTYHILIPNINIILIYTVYIYTFIYIYGDNNTNTSLRESQWEIYI